MKTSAFFLMPAKALRSSPLGLRAFNSTLKGGPFSDLKKVKVRLMKTKILGSRAKRDEAAVLETCHSIIHPQQVISRPQAAYGEEMLASSPGKGANEKHRSELRYRPQPRKTGAMCRS
jgi:hypothetical protein